MPEPIGAAKQVALTLKVVGDRWTILVLLDLLRGLHRFNDLEASVQGISSNILSDRLKLLKRHGIVRREFYSEHPPRAEYYLTRKGHELGIVAGAVASWGTKYFSDASVLVHSECNSPLNVVYYCPTCEAQVPGAQVRLVERDVKAQGR